MDRRRIKKQCSVFVLGFATLFLTISLLSFDRADPPGRAVLPVNDPVHNWCGPVGAAVSYSALSILGVGVYVVIWVVGVVVLSIIRQRPIDDVLLRTIGIVLVVLAASAIGARAFPASLSPLPVGSGGYVGMAIASFLDRHLGGKSSGE